MIQLGNFQYNLWLFGWFFSCLFLGEITWELTWVKLCINASTCIEGLIGSVHDCFTVLPMCLKGIVLKVNRFLTKGILDGFRDMRSCPSASGIKGKRGRVCVRGKGYLQDFPSNLHRICLLQLSQRWNFQNFQLLDGMTQKSTINNQSYCKSWNSNNSNNNNIAIHERTFINLENTSWYLPNSNRIILGGCFTLENFNRQHHPPLQCKRDKNIQHPSTSNENQGLVQDSSWKSRFGPGLVQENQGLVHH